MNVYKKVALLSLILAVTLTYAPGVFAFTYGSNITLYDGEGSVSEDNEVELGMDLKQHWDLEGIFLNGKTLTLIGGFDFKNGVTGYTPTTSNVYDFTSGDIFISTDSNYGRVAALSPIQVVNSTTGIATTTTYDPLAKVNGNINVNSSFGYEYALDINWNTLAFNVVNLSGASTTTAYYYQNEDGNPSSNPWKYFMGGEIKGSGTGNYLGLISDSGFSGMNGDNRHFAVSFDLSSVIADADLYGKEFYTHFTMGCGNDNLMGHGVAPVPEPGTMMLLGVGILGLAIFGKRRMNKDS
jgi:hypothetical protein